MSFFDAQYDSAVAEVTALTERLTTEAPAPRLTQVQMLLMSAHDIIAKDMKAALERGDTTTWHILKLWAREIRFFSAQGLIDAMTPKGPAKEDLHDS
jgi:hypothetical protein